MNAENRKKLGSTINSGFANKTISLLLKKCKNIIGSNGLDVYSQAAIRKRHDLAMKVIRDTKNEQNQLFIQLIANSVDAVADAYQLNGDTFDYIGPQDEEENIISAAIDEVFDNMAGVMASEKIPDGGTALSSLVFDMPSKNDIPDYVGQEISRKAFYEGMEILDGTGEEQTPGEKRKAAITLTVRHYNENGVYISSLDKEWISSAVNNDSHPVEQLRNEFDQVYQAAIVENKPLVPLIRLKIETSLATGLYESQVTY